MCKLLGVDKIYTTPYRPQANGLLERTHGILMQSLRTAVQEDVDNWDKYVPAAVFAYNMTPSSATGFAPFKLLYGRVPRFPLEVAFQGGEGVEEQEIGEYVGKQEELARSMRAMLKENLNRAKDKQDDKALNVRELYKFQPGDWVYVDIRAPHRQGKLMDKFEGPFVITSVQGDYVCMDKGDGEERREHKTRIKPSHVNPYAREKALEERPVDVPSDINEKSVVGKRIRVRWNQREDYDGTVMGRRANRHLVVYDDGDVQLETLFGDEREMWWLLVDQEVEAETDATGTPTFA